MKRAQRVTLAVLIFSCEVASQDLFVDAEKKTQELANITKFSPMTGAAATRLNMYLTMNCDKPVTRAVLATGLKSDRFRALSQRMSNNKSIGMNETKKILKGIEKEVACDNN